MSVLIQFDQGLINSNTKTILQASTLVESQAAKDSYNIIIQTASSFIGQYLNALQQITNFENALKRTIKDWHSFKAECQKNGLAYKQTTKYDTYIRERANIRKENFTQLIKNNILNVYKFAMQFQEYLNAALEQLIATAYVWVGAGGVPETYVIHDMSDFLKVDVDRYGNVVVRYRNNAKMLRNHTDAIEKSIQKDTAEFNFSLLRSTYQDAAKRYNSHKLARGGAYVLWLYPYSGQKWNGMLVSSFGSINEAYATLLLHQHFNPSNTPEDNMEQFMNYVLNVTNLSGTLEGDTTVGNMEMAVKSSQATTLSIKQLYDMAQDIIKSKLNNFGAIQNYLMKKKQENKNAEHAINVSLKDCLQNMANEHLEPIIAGFGK